MTAKVSKRLCAFLIDIFIVYMISAIITGFIPQNDKTKSLYIELNETAKLITEKKINTTEFYERVNDINYELSKETVIITIVDIVVYIMYFVILPFYNCGKTFGKKLLKIKITGNNDNEVSVNSYLFRSFILNSIAIKIILLVLILSVNKATYISTANTIGYIQMGIIITIVLMIITRKDSRGLHDLIANTKVVEE